MPLTVRRTPRTAQGFSEPLLDVGDALPLQMVLIPGGTFMMGSPDDEPERFEVEGPQHEVRVGSFFMGRYPVTQAQWRAVAALREVPFEPDPSIFKGHNRPVENEAWWGAVDFCVTLSAHTGRSYRLPSEAEWEYACRAGTTTPFYFGKTLTPELANYAASSLGDGYGDGRGDGYGDGRGDRSVNRNLNGTTAVDHFGIANAFGLSDMHGNVLEWCQDHWHDSYGGAPCDGSAWLEGGNSEFRILRGGSWLEVARDCRSACRSYLNMPDGRNNAIGFRVVCSAPRAL